MTGIEDILVLAGMLGLMALAAWWEPRPKRRRFRHLTRGGRR